MKNPKRRISVAILIVSLFLTACSPEPASSTKQSPVSLERLKEHLEYLASDETEGRMTGSDGYKKAADYAAGQFSSFGLAPGWTGDDGKKTYLQPVPFIRYRYGLNNILTIKTNDEIKKFNAESRKFEVLCPGKGSLDIQQAQPVFVGYGIYEPDLGWDDYAGLDVEGKILIMMMNLPESSNQPEEMPTSVLQKYSDGRNRDVFRIQTIIEKKAAGAIIVPDRNFLRFWDRVLAQRKRINFTPAEDYRGVGHAEPPIPIILVHPDIAEDLFAGAGFNPVSGEGEYRTHIMNETGVALRIDVTKETFNCYNVIASLPGTDPERADEFVTVGAHLDHLGKEGNVVFYGANDDASGCAAVLQIAEAVAANPLPRPVIFVLFTAEETSFFAGSLHFIAHSPVPVENIMVNVNLEQLAGKNRTVRGAEGYGPESFRESFLAAEKRAPKLDVPYYPWESRLSVIGGSDTWSFYLKDVPGVLIGAGGFPEHHTPQDNLDLIDFEHFQKVTLFIYEFIRELGNTEKEI